MYCRRATRDLACGERVTDTAEPLTPFATIHIVVDWTLRRQSDRNDSISVEVERRSETVARAVWGRLMKLAGEASIDPLADSVRLRLSWPARAGGVAEVVFRPSESSTLADLEYQLIWGVARTLERRPPA